MSGPYFPVLGLNTEYCTGKYGPDITPHLNTFHAVLVYASLNLLFKSTMQV